MRTGRSERIPYLPGENLPGLSPENPYGYSEVHRREDGADEGGLEGSAGRTGPLCPTHKLKVRNEEKEEENTKEKERKELKMGWLIRVFEVCAESDQFPLERQKSIADGIRDIGMIHSGIIGQDHLRCASRGGIPVKNRLEVLVDLRQHESVSVRGQTGSITHTA